MEAELRSGHENECNFMWISLSIITMVRNGKMILFSNWLEREKHLTRVIGNTSYF